VPRPRPRPSGRRGNCPPAPRVHGQKSGAPIVKKLIESAVANARTQSPGVDLDTLFVETAFVDKAPNKHMRRWRPRAMGRATRVQKGMSHITIILGER
jgi:large subunit ribosomal protein L22